MTLTARLAISEPGTIGLMPCELAVGLTAIEATFVPGTTPSVTLTWVPARTVPTIWQVPAVRPTVPVTAVGPAAPLELRANGG